MTDVWTEERVEQLRALYPKGVSPSRIAKLLGLESRNQVCGKAFRLGLTHGSTITRETNAQASKLRARIAREAKPALEPKPQALQEPQLRAPNIVPIRPPEPVAFQGPSKLLTELCARECRWPLNDPGSGHMDETRFCGSPDAPSLGEGMPYCEHHRRLACVPARTRKPATEPSPARWRAS